MATVNEVLAETATRLAAAGIAEPRLEARVLAGAVLGFTREALLAHGEAEIEPAAVSRLAAYAARRAEGEPVARILGRKEFWSLEFEVTADTLIPRPETETLIEAALATITDRGAAITVLDLGTGSGCLLLALLSELPNARGVGVDINPGAIAVARRNAERFHLSPRTTFICGDFAVEPQGRRFDIILSNPPYIPEGDIDGLARDVACYEPRRALSGGGDGLAAYRALAPRIARSLVPGGRAFLEIGEGQADRVAAIMTAAGLAVAARDVDLAGIVRCLTVVRAAL